MRKAITRILILSVLVATFESCASSKLPKRHGKAPKGKPIPCPVKDC